MKDFFKRHFGLAHHTGFVLVLSLFIILGFFVLAMVAIAIMAAGTDIYVQELNSAQAFYLAEAARNFTLEYYLSWGTRFTDTTRFPNFTRTFPVGSFNVNYANRTQRACDITFDGSITGLTPPITRRIFQHFASNINDYFSGALLSRGNFGNCLSPNVQSELTINGNIYFLDNPRFGWDICSRGGASGALDCRVCQGNIPPDTCPVCSGWAACTSGCTGSGPGPTITGNVFVDGDAKVYSTSLTGNITASGTISTQPVLCANSGSISNCTPPICNPNTPVTIPAKPAIDQTYYDFEINRALNNPDYGTHTWEEYLLSDIPAVLKAEGRSLYVMGALVINENIINGPKNIVAGGGYIGTTNGVRVGERIALISNGAISAINPGVRVGGTWNGTNMVGAGALLYARNSTDDDTSMNVSGISTNWARVKGALVTPTSGTQKFRSINVSGSSWLEGVIYGKTINNWFGTVRGSVAIDGPIWCPGGCTYANSLYGILRSANITYDNSLIPLSIKGLYSCSGGDWQELNQ